jgi:hypothetical protein
MKNVKYARLVHVALSHCWPAPSHVHSRQTIQERSQTDNVYSINDQVVRGFLRQVAPMLLVTSWCKHNILLQLP